ncbi:DUF3833 domain-containing protein [Parasalinivibrio latis]|uniref:DUF3833 domain-containing protein n=1 Tax=Parasalinivibrio latis TaxID=2952610 RepID=UPI0030E08420
MKKIALVCLLFITSCSTSIEDYAEQNPLFDLFGFFEGKVSAWGMLQDFSGMQTRRFTVDIVGTVDGNCITLDETFLFDDGEKQKRVWVITQSDDGTYSGTAGDVVGVATGKVSGNVLHWVYKLRIPYDGDEITLTLDDWLYRQDQNHMFNLTSMKKFGIEVGKLTLFFQKQPD